jgi:hypothetical protein
MKYIIHSNNRFVKGTLLKKILDKCDLDMVQVWLDRLCSLDLLCCCWTTNHGSHSVAGFEGRDQSSETQMAICAGDLKFVRNENIEGVLEDLLVRTFVPF